jgi:flagellar operon protein
MKISELQIQKNYQTMEIARNSGKIPQQGNFGPVDGKKGRLDFSEMLTQTLKPERKLVFSAHAQKRINDRNINVDLERLDNGISQVDKKGAKNTLVMMDNNAFIVNVKNKTVITAIDQQSIKNNVFTNIDSVAIV